MSNKVVDWKDVINPLGCYRHDLDRNAVYELRYGPDSDVWRGRLCDFSPAQNISNLQYRPVNVEPQEPPLCEHTLRRVLQALPGNKEEHELGWGSYNDALNDTRRCIRSLMPKSPLTAILSAITSEDEAMDREYRKGFHEALRRLHDKGLLREVGE